MFLIKNLQINPVSALNKPLEVDMPLNKYTYETKRNETKQLKLIAQYYRWIMQELNYFSLFPWKITIASYAYSLTITKDSKSFW